MKEKLVSNWGLKIFSVACAALIWLAVTNTIDPSITKTINNIPIKVTDESILTKQNKVYTVNSSSVASVKVKGKRSIVSDLTAEDFMATAPVDEMSIVNALPVYINVKNSRYRDNLEILDKTNSISISIEDVIKKSYDIQVEYTGDVAEGYYRQDAVLSNSKIEVTAPESIHNLINRVAINIDVSDAKEDISGKYTPKLYKADGKEIQNVGNITFSRPKVKADVEILKTKNVELEFKTVGTPEKGYECTKVKADPEKVTIVGREDVIDSVDKITVASTSLTIAGANKNVERTIDITPYLPTGVSVLDQETTLVDVTAVVEAHVIRQYSITADDIKMTNIPEEYAASPVNDQKVDFTLTGLQDKLDQFDVNSLDASVDLKKAKKGENRLRVKMNLPEGVTLKEKVYIDVTLVEKETDSE